MAPLAVTLTVLLVFVALAYAIDKNSSPLQLRIVGANYAKKNQFSYLVSLQIQPKRSSSAPYKHKCGGSIISPTWILTAAHCISNSYKYRIVAGVLKLSDEKLGQVIKVTKTIVHPKFNKPTKFSNDIALLQLEKPLKFNDSVKTIQLSKYRLRYNMRRIKLVVAGWGSTLPNSTNISDELKAAIVYFTTFHDCYMMFYEKFRLNTNETVHTFNEYNFCSGNIPEAVLNKKTIGPCYGDEGGPSVNYINGELHGVLSWVVQPCADNIYIYTAVEHFRDFIGNHVQDLPEYKRFRLG